MEDVEDMDGFLLFGRDGILNAGAIGEIDRRSNRTIRLIEGSESHPLFASLGEAVGLLFREDKEDDQGQNPFEVKAEED